MSLLAAVGSRDYVYRFTGHLMMKRSYCVEQVEEKVDRKSQKIFKPQHRNKNFTAQLKIHDHKMDLINERIKGQASDIMRLDKGVTENKRENKELIRENKELIRQVEFRLQEHLEKFQINNKEEFKINRKDLEINRKEFKEELLCIRKEIKEEFKNNREELEYNRKKFEERLESNRKEFKEDLEINRKDFKEEFKNNREEFKNNREEFKNNREEFKELNKKIDAVSKKNFAFLGTILAICIGLLSLSDNLEKKINKKWKLLPHTSDSELE